MIKFQSVLLVLISLGHYFATVVGFNTVYKLTVETKVLSNHNGKQVV